MFPATPLAREKHANRPCGQPSGCYRRLRARLLARQAAGLTNMFARAARGGSPSTSPAREKARSDEGRTNLRIVRWCNHEPDQGRVLVCDVPLARTATSSGPRTRYFGRNHSPFQRWKDFASKWGTLPFPHSTSRIQRLPAATASAGNGLARMTLLIRHAPIFTMWFRAGIQASVPSRPSASLAEIASAAAWTVVPGAETS